MASVEEIRALLKPLNDRLSEMSEKLDALETMKKTVGSMQDEITALSKENHILWKHISSITAKQDFIEYQDRRMNVLIHGVPETQIETWSQTKELVTKILKKGGLDIKEQDIQRAHRLHGNLRPRIIVVKFAHWELRERTKRLRRFMFEDTCIRITDDQTKLTKEKRRMMGEIQQAAYQQRHRTFFVGEKLIVNKLCFTVDPLLTKVHVEGNHPPRTVGDVQEAMEVINCDVYGQAIGSSSSKRDPTTPTTPTHLYNPKKRLERDTMSHEDHAAEEDMEKS